MPRRWAACSCGCEFSFCHNCLQCLASWDCSKLRSSEELRSWHVSRMGHPPEHGSGSEHQPSPSEFAARAALARLRHSLGGGGRPATWVRVELSSGGSAKRRGQGHPGVPGAAKGTAVHLMRSPSLSLSIEALRPGGLVVLRDPSPGQVDPGLSHGRLLTLYRKTQREPPACCPWARHAGSDLDSQIHSGAACKRRWNLPSMVQRSPFLKPSLPFMICPSWLLCESL